MKTTEIYRLHAMYPNAESGEVFEAELKVLSSVCKSKLSDPQNFILQISTIPIIYNDDGALNMDCAQNLEFESCSMGDLDKWAK